MWLLMLVNMLCSLCFGFLVCHSLRLLDHFLFVVIDDEDLVWVEN